MIVNFLEKDLEDIIFEAQQTKAGRDFLRQRGLIIRGKMFRQVQLGDYGVCDLLTVYIDSFRNIHATVYELKKDAVCIDTFEQAARYATAVKCIFDKLKLSDIFNTINTDIVLIGKWVESESNFVFLYNVIENLTIFTYQFLIDGLVFKRESKCWAITGAKLPDVKLSISDVKEMHTR